MMTAATGVKVMLAITQGFTKAMQASIERNLSERKLVEWIPASHPRTAKKRKDLGATVEQAA